MSDDQALIDAIDNLHKLTRLFRTCSTAATFHYVICNVYPELIHFLVTRGRWLFERALEQTREEVRMCNEGEECDCRQNLKEWEWYANIVVTQGRDLEKERRFAWDVGVFAEPWKNLLD